MKDEFKDIGSGVDKISSSAEPLIEPPLLHINLALPITGQRTDVIVAQPGNVGSAFAPAEPLRQHNTGAFRPGLTEPFAVADAAAGSRILNVEAVVFPSTPDVIGQRSVPSFEIHRADTERLADTPHVGDLALNWPDDPSQYPDETRWQPPPTGDSGGEDPPPFQVELSVEVSNTPAHYPIVNRDELLHELRNQDLGHAINPTDLSPESSALSSVIADCTRGEMTISGWDEPHLPIDQQSTPVLQIDLQALAPIDKEHASSSLTPWMVIDTEALSRAPSSMSPEDRIEAIQAGTLNLNNALYLGTIFEAPPTPGTSAIDTVSLSTATVIDSAVLEPQLLGSIATTWSPGRWADSGADEYTSDAPDDPAVAEPEAGRGANQQPIPPPSALEQAGGVGVGGGADSGSGGGGGHGGDGSDGDEGSSEGGSSSETGPGLVARMAQHWARTAWRQDLGPHLGQVTQRLSEIDMSTAIPAFDPPSGLIDSDLMGQFEGSGSGELHRANLWVLALEEHLFRNQSLAPPGLVQTTFGFAVSDSAVRLSVIHYVNPRRMFRLRPPQPVELAQKSFPTIVRPWLPVQQAARAPADTAQQHGNCWVALPVSEGGGTGLLTANHAVPRAAIGDRVTASTRRNPPEGTLRLRSFVMDAAVLKVQAADVQSNSTATISRVMGLKPVRMVTGHGSLDADVVEVPSTRGVILANPGSEPSQSARLRMNRHLDEGDSGCVILDCEPEMYGAQALPYLMYLGYDALGTAPNERLGAGILLEQIRRTWDIELLNG